MMKNGDDPSIAGLSPRERRKLFEGFPRQGQPGSISARAEEARIRRRRV